jgi:hypothetical protein
LQIEIELAVRTFDTIYLSSQGVGGKDLMTKRNGRREYFKLEYVPSDFTITIREKTY